MHPMIFRSALTAALLVATSSAALAAHLQPVPACDVSHNQNGKVCDLRLRDGDLSGLSGWQILAGDPEMHTTADGSHIRLAQPSVGISQVVGLPLGSTVDPNHMPTYWVDLRVRTAPLSPVEEGTSQGSALARVRVSLTDEHGEHGLLLDEATVEASADGWDIASLSVDTEPYHFNAFLKIEVTRLDSDSRVALDIDDIAITQLTL